MTEDKKYLIDYRAGGLDCPDIERRIGTTLPAQMYSYGINLGFDGFYESDIQWIENNITKNSQNKNRDIFWRLDSCLDREKNISPYFLDYTATFFEQFIDMPGIPRNVNGLLIYTVGRLRAWYNVETVALYQHFFIERWMETCR